MTIEQVIDRLFEMANKRRKKAIASQEVGVWMQVTALETAAHAIIAEHSNEKQAAK